MFFWELCFQLSEVWGLSAEQKKLWSLHHTNNHNALFWPYTMRSRTFSSGAGKGILRWIPHSGHSPPRAILVAESSFEVTETQEVPQRRSQRRMVDAERQGLEETRMKSQLLGCWHSDRALPFEITAIWVILTVFPEGHKALQKSILLHFSRCGQDFLPISRVIHHRSIETHGTTPV